MHSYSINNFSKNQNREKNIYFCLLVPIPGSEIGGGVFWFLDDKAIKNFRQGPKS